MADSESSFSSLETLATELAELRNSLSAQNTMIATQQAALLEQQSVITQQQAAIAALQQGMNRAQSPSGQLAVASAEYAPLAQDSASDEDDEPGEEQPYVARRGTSRRGFLGAAAASAAAATVATVALGGVQQAYAAPAVTGGNFLLGATNDADATTTLTFTASTTPSPILSVTAPVSTASAFYTAIAAKSASGTAVYGTDNQAGGTGVLGDGATTTGVGVVGTSDVGYGVIGASSTGTDLAAYGSGLIYQLPQSSAGAPTGGSYYPGVTIVDANSDLWMCVAAGSPGTWVKMAHALPGFTGGAITFLNKPVRLLDTRAGAAAADTPGTPCKPGTIFTLPVAGVKYNGVSVPASAQGAIGNVTVINEQGEGFIELVPSGAGDAGVSNLDFFPNTILGNSFTVGLAGGKLDIIMVDAGADVIIDLFAIVA